MQNELAYTDDFDRDRRRNLNPENRFRAVELISRPASESRNADGGLRNFLRVVIKNKVEFLVVGGYAVGVHGYPRYASDLDIFVAVNPKNTARLVNVFFSIGKAKDEVQVLTSVSGVDFWSAYKNRVEVSLGELAVPFIGIDHLLINKQAAGRRKDLIDLKELERNHPRNAQRHPS